MSDPELSPSHVYESLKALLPLESVARNSTVEPLGTFMLLAQVPQSVFSSAVQEPPSTRTWTLLGFGSAFTLTSTHHSFTLEETSKDAL